VGLALAPLFARRRVVEGVLLCEGATWPRKLGWRYSAITFGHVVLSAGPASRALMAHELVHVRQYERLGPLFLPAYLLASAWAWLKGGRAYADNAFERRARSGAED
jgi:hypothetical protein